MPRKTKKISTVKPEDTKPQTQDCSCAVIATLVVVGLLTGAFFGIKALVTTPTPQYGECYQHREDTNIVARVTNTEYHSYGTEVSYNIESNEYTGYTQDLQRWDDSFADKYEKLENCEKYYRMRAERERDELSNELIEAKDQLNALKAKKHQ